MVGVQYPKKKLLVGSLLPALNKKKRNIDIPKSWINHAA